MSSDVAVLKRIYGFVDVTLYKPYEQGDVALYRSSDVGSVRIYIDSQYNCTDLHEYMSDYMDMLIEQTLYEHSTKIKVFQIWSFFMENFQRP